MPRLLSLLSFALCLIWINSVDCLTCYCKNTACNNLITCTNDNPYSYCDITIDSAGNVYQGCEDDIADYQTCTGKLSFNPGAHTPYQMCCRTTKCNSLEAIQKEINALTSSQIYPSSSSLPASLLTSSLPVTTITPTSSILATTALFASVQQTTVTYPTSTLTISGTDFPSLTTDPTDQSSSGVAPSYAIAVIVVLTFLLAVFIIIIVIVFFLHFYPRHIVGVAVPIESDGTPTLSTISCGEFSSDKTLHDLLDGTTSGSGSGLPLLVQRSVATQVTLCELVGKGRFGEVWRGSYKGDNIAVKIFHTKEEASWFHEVDIYQTCLIRHPNILRFVAADNKDIGIATQLWLITEYCNLGSLYEVLLNQTLDEKTLLKLCCTAASGLAHLHSEINGTEGKPAIAHRDIKSRNILVKQDYSCCIADLGLALRYNRNTDTVEEPPTKRVGTRRYLSPEILDDTMDTKNFDFFKRSDMYSFGLVLWEIARRGLCAGHAEEYQLPYFDLVTPDPSFEEMKRVVAIDRRRPGFPNRWSQSKVFDDLAQIIDQCWHHNGEARLTALRVKKNLNNLISTHEKPKDDNVTTNQIQISL